MGKTMPILDMKIVSSGVPNQILLRCIQDPDWLFRDSADDFIVRDTILYVVIHLPDLLF